jgi:5-methylthioadenosine/S-adenosylhomocysteine deaminase
MPLTPQPPADLVVHGGVVLTADPDRPLVKDGMLVVRDGRIAAIADGADPETIGRAKRAIDLSGKVATPGFVNVHTHTILTMVRGVAEDMGFAPAYTPGVPHGHEVSPDEAVALARLGALEAMLFGSTLINDTYVHADLTLPAMAELGLRVYACGRIHDVDFSRVHVQEWTHRREIGARTLDEALRLFETWHGAENGRLGVQLAAHAPDTCSRALLKDVRRARDASGMRVNTHLAQSKVEVARIKERDGMTPAELLDDVGLLDERLLAAHCIHMSDHDIARAGRAGITVAHIPKGNATGGTIAPTSKLRRAGAHIALGTDNMHADMVEVMRWALNIGRIQEGLVDDLWQPRDVLAMATMGGARAMGLENEIGSISVGKKADLVVFDFQRPHLVPQIESLGNLVHTAQGRDVETVVVDGRIVVEDSRPTLVDAAEIIAAGTKAAEALWARARATA